MHNFQLFISFYLHSCSCRSLCILAKSVTLNLFNIIFSNLYFPRPHLLQN